MIRPITLFLPFLALINRFRCKSRAPVVGNGHMEVALFR